MKGKRQNFPASPLRHALSTCCIAVNAVRWTAIEQAVLGFSLLPFDFCNLPFDLFVCPKQGSL
jgi:hypothetical protein